MKNSKGKGKSWTKDAPPRVDKGKGKGKKGKGKGDAGTGPPDVEEGLLSEILSSLRVKSADEEWKAGEDRSYTRGVRHGVSREEMLQQIRTFSYVLPHGSDVREAARTLQKGGPPTHHVTKPQDEQGAKNSLDGAPTPGEVPRTSTGGAPFLPEAVPWSAVKGATKTETKVREAYKNILSVVQRGKPCSIPDKEAETMKLLQTIRDAIEGLFPTVDDSIGSHARKLVPLVQLALSPCFENEEFATTMWPALLPLLPASGVGVVDHLPQQDEDLEDPKWNFYDVGAGGASAEVLEILSKIFQKLKLLSDVVNVLGQLEVESGDPVSATVRHWQMRVLAITLTGATFVQARFRPCRFIKELVPVFLGERWESVRQKLFFGKTNLLYWGRLLPTSLTWHREGLDEERRAKKDLAEAQEFSLKPEDSIWLNWSSEQLDTSLLALML